MKKTKKSDKLKEPRMVSHPIWGMLDASDLARTKKTKKKNLTPKNIIPEIKYDLSKTKPDLGGKKIRLDNTVSMPIELLKSIQDKSQQRGQTLSDVMLRSVIPSVFGLSGAEDYTTTVLVDGFGFKPENINLNSEVSNILSLIGSLEVITALVRKTSLPRAMKKAMLMKMADDMAAGISNKLMTADKSKELSRLIKNGIVVSSRKGSVEAEAEELDKKPSNRLGKMRGRQEKFH